VVEYLLSDVVLRQLDEGERRAAGVALLVGRNRDRGDARASCCMSSGLWLGSNASDRRRTDCLMVAALEETRQDDGCVREPGVQSTRRRSHARMGCRFEPQLVLALSAICCA